MDKLTLVLLNGISYGMVLFLIAAGLSLILGLMGIVNIAHGAIFVWGGIIGITVAKSTNSFLLGILAGAVSSGMVGMIIERGVLKFFYKKELQQVLVTFGFVFIISNLILWIWGPVPRNAFVPSYFISSIPINGVMFPFHRFVNIIVGVVLFFALWWLQDKTKTGAVIRAGMDDAEMVSALRINLIPYNIGAFFVGSAIAGAGCVVGAQLFGSVSFGDGMHFLLLAIAVVIIGGVGSVQGTITGALLIGVIDNLGRAYFPAAAQFTMYLLMIIVLVSKPSGLLGRKK